MTTPVIFRVSRDNPDDVYALFPEELGSYEARTCSCYQHTGQHSIADPYACIRSSRPARPEEYAKLLRELEVLGYDDLRIVARHTHRHLETREQALRIAATFRSEINKEFTP